MERQLGELEERQKQLAAMCESALVEAASGHLPADGGASELRLAAGVLASVAGNPHAAHKLLAAHSMRLKRAQQLLLKPQNAGVFPCRPRAHIRSMHLAPRLQEEFCLSSISTISIV